MKPSIETCYKLLDVRSDCTLEELKKSHKELAQVWHPDRFGNNEELQKKALDKIQEINSAYDQIREYRSLKARGLTNKGQQNKASAETYAMEGRDSVQLTAPLVPIKYRIMMLIGFGTCLVLLLILLSQRNYENGDQQGGLTLIKNSQKNLEIRDETYVMRQQLINRLQNKIDVYLTDLVGNNNYESDIYLEVDEESKMILQIKMLIRLNQNAFQNPTKDASSQMSCQQASLHQLKSAIQRIARLVPSRGDQLEVLCVPF